MQAENDCETHCSNTGRVKAIGVKQFKWAAKVNKIVFTWCAIEFTFYRPGKIINFFFFSVRMLDLLPGLN